MAVTFMGGGRATAGTVPGTVSLFGTFAAGASDAVIGRVARSPGTVRRLGASIDAAGTARVIRFRKNSANANLVLTPPDSVAVQAYDTVNSDHLASGDIFNLTFAGSAAFIPFQILAQFFADTGTVGMYQSSGVSFGATATTSFMSTFQGISNPTESLEQALIRAPGVFKNLQMLITVPASTSTITMTSRKNAAAGAMTATAAANTTGTFEDPNPAHTDTLAAGDKFNTQIVASATGGTNATIFAAVEIAYSTVNSELSIGRRGINFGATNQFFTLAAGNSLAAITTEATVQSSLGIFGTFSNLRLGILSNSLTSPWTFALRKNGANGNQTLTVAAGATGIVEDPTNTDAFAPTDNLNFISSGGTAGQIIPEWGFLTLAPFTPILAAATGSFSLAGQAATFQVIEGAATGSFAFTGVAASFKIVETAATGAFALTGGAAAFTLSGSVAPGAFALTGNSAFFQTFLSVEAGAFIFNGGDVQFEANSGTLFDASFGGIGHFLEELERARQLAAITRETPPPIDRRTAPQFQPFPASYSVQIAPAVDMAAVEKQRMAEQAAALAAAKKQRELEAILLLFS